jgi:hypothetical protein
MVHVVPGSGRLAAFMPEMNILGCNSQCRYYA